MQKQLYTLGATGEKDQLRRNFDGVLERFARAVARSGRNLDDVQLVAVSKRQSLAAVITVAEHWQNMGGRPVFGESYMQEALAKQDGATRLGQNFAWHFIGRLQSNKAKQAVGRFALIHTLDSVALARNLQKTLQRNENTGKGLCPFGHQPALVQVNLGLEESKSGVSPEKLEELLLALREFAEIRAQGLMILPPFSPDPEDVRPYFIRLRQMRDRLEERLETRLPHLSMGMSHDFEAAIEEGATLVRVGTDIFGQRQY